MEYLLIFDDSSMLFCSNLTEHEYKAVADGVLTVINVVNRTYLGRDGKFITIPTFN